MNWRWYVGSKANSAVHRLLSAKRFPLTRHFPRGFSWLYDCQRFANCKDLAVLFDVGANVGQTVDGMLRYFPGASVYCFEPTSAAFSVLAAKYGAKRNVKLLKVALGSSASDAQMALHMDSELNTLVVGGPRTSDITGSSETVHIETLDSVCDSENIPAIDILKMDVQGWELEVLRGASTMLSGRKIRFIFSEVAFRRADDDMQQFTGLNEFLETAGFWFCGFYNPFRWGARKEFVGFANALYMDPDHRSEAR